MDNPAVQAEPQSAENALQTPLIKADLHLHTNWSKDGAMAPAKLAAVAKRRGLNCIAVTDHNTMAGVWEIIDEPGITIIPGEEVRSDAGEITGLFLQEEIPKGLPALEVARRIKDQGGLVCVPHPFDRLRRSVLQAAALMEILPLVDVIEVFNSRNTLPQDNARALRFALAHNLAASGGSDAHVPFEVGRTVVEMPPFDGPEEFLASLRQGQVIGRASPWPVHLVSTWAKMRARFRPKS